MQEDIKIKKYCIYIHTSPSGKKYVGQTGMKPEQRWRNGGKGYLSKKDGKYVQPMFAHAILKYGWDSFKHEIVAYDLTKKEADKLEKSLIEKLNTMDSNYGYNLREGGSHGSLSEETRKKMSESQSGKNLSEETRKKISESSIGKHLSEETKRKIANASKDRQYSEDFRKKMSELKKGEKHHFYGKNLSEETRKKISESLKGLHTGANHYKSRKIVQYDLNENFIKVWDSMREIEKEIGIAHGNIYKCCTGKYKKTGGYVWRYYEDVIRKEVI